MRLLVLIAAVTVATGLGISKGLFNPFALALVTLGGGAGIAAVLVGRSSKVGHLPTWEPGMVGLHTKLLWFALMAGVLSNFIVPLGSHVDRERLTLFWPMLAVLRRC